MSTVQYDTDVATFTFDYEMLVEMLKHSIKSNDVEEDRLCLAEIQSRTSSGGRDITITDQDEGDYISRFIYVVSDLLYQGNGTVYCKLCRQEYSSSNPTELTVKRITPFTRSNNMDHTVFRKVVRIIKRCFDFKKPIYVPGSGGTVVTCKKCNTELFRTIEWIT